MSAVLQVVASLAFLTGIALVVTSALAALRLRDAADRLHLLAPMTTLGVPLTGVGLILHRGWSLPGAEICLTCLLLALTGPVMAAAAARVAGVREGSIPKEEPE